MGQLITKRRFPSTTERHRRLPYELTDLTGSNTSPKSIGALALDQVGPVLLSLYKRASSSISKHLVQIVAIDSEIRGRLR